MNIAQATKRILEQLYAQKDTNFYQLTTLFGMPYTTEKSIIYGDSKSHCVTTIKNMCNGLEISIPEFFGSDLFKNLEQEIE